MTPEEVPADLVEKAARAMYEANSYRVQGSNSFGLLVGARLPWKHLLPSDIKKLRSEARHGLAAVLPEIQAQALRDAADDVDRFPAPEWGGRRVVKPWLIERADRLRSTTEGKP